MQYLVRQIRSNSASSPKTEDTWVFPKLSEVIKHIRKFSLDEKLMIDDTESSLEVLANYLKERLSTVSLRAARERKDQWVITAF